MDLQNITLNFAPVVRHEELHGRPYIVAPMAMMTEGVHNGSNGPLFYPAAELKKTPVVWNMKPVVVYHPGMNGRGISACDPDVLEKQQVGMVMNAHYDKKLRAEAWLEVERLKAVDERVLNALEKGELMEVSTGLFTDNEFDPGQFGTEDYELVARNHRPDHLAILPDKIGACSIADGAGLLQLNQLAEDIDGLDVDHFHAIALGDVGRMVANAMSHSDTYSLLSQAVRGRFGDNVYVIDVFDKFLIYEFGRTLFRLGYKIKKAVVTLEGSPEEVTRTTQYRKADGSLVANANATVGKDDVMNKEQFVADLIANEDTAWTDEDRDFLMAQNEDELKKFAPVGNEGGGKMPPGKKKGKKDDEEEDSGVSANEAAVNAAAQRGAAELQPTANEAKPITIDQLPPEMQAVYNHGAAALQRERDDLIATITKNDKNTFSGDQLAAMDLPQLQGLAALAAQPADNGTQPGRVPHYGGQATPPPTGNQLTENEEEPLVMPTMNFETAGA